MTNEIWKPVILNKYYQDKFNLPENYFSDCYHVSNFGRIKSLTGHRYKEDTILNRKLDSKGYCIFSLSKNKIRCFIPLHQLIAMVFITNPNNYIEINHKDEDPSNNCVDNLEWCDRKYNNNYGNRLEKVGKSISKTKCETISTPVDCYTLDDKFIKHYEALVHVELDGHMHGHVRECCLGIRNKHHNLKWKYSETN